MESQLLAAAFETVPAHIDLLLLRMPKGAVRHDGDYPPRKMRMLFGGAYTMHDVYG
jgi:hypothetical protein